MGLKLVWWLMPCINSGLVKIRPKWDWNDLILTYKENLNKVKIRPKWDWNFFHPFVSPISFLLKSDQNGIEIKKFFRIIFFKISTLKSDQNGIEIKSFYCSLHSYHVKIRPKWDWNVISWHLHLHGSLQLKSDQNGIEIRPPVSLLFRPPVSLLFLSSSG